MIRLEKNVKVEDPTDDEDLYGALLNLAQMINEAWYECING